MVDIVGVCKGDPLSGVKEGHKQSGKLAFFAFLLWKFMPVARYCPVGNKCSPSPGFGMVLKQMERGN